MPVEIREDDRFIASRADFERWAAGKKQLRMEFFYREMRRRTGLLMDGEEPAGGQWNYDAENRKKLPKGVMPPARAWVEPDALTRVVLADVQTHFPEHFGDLEPFGFAVTRADAQRLADIFIADILPGFGDWQDAIARGEPWMWHSVISMYLNAGLLEPLALCRAAEVAWRKGRAPLNAVEGFIRQILGWREFIRGIYWHFMPGYRDLNALEAKGKLPAFYWTGETGMACMADAITQTKRHAYSHHIQRLMVTGNFALLIGADPAEVQRWYLEVYADAYEWVEAPNTLGMSQFGDGGLLGSKPYASSGAYIDRMSDYCGHCRYDVKARTGPKACPFNALYWDFLVRNREKLGSNQRLAMPYRNWDRMDPDMQRALRAQAKAFLVGLDEG